MENRTWLLAASVVLAVLLSPVAVSAQTPTYGNLELRFGPYYPSIDKEDGLQGSPFADTFASHKPVEAPLLQLLDTLAY